MVLYINFVNNFIIISQTVFNLQSGYEDMVKCSKGNNSKNRQTRVTVHVFCKSSHSALHLCEIS